MSKYRIVIEMDTCTAGSGCPLRCLTVCPTKVIGHRPLNPADPNGGVHIQATHPLLCDGCMACVDTCDPGAITVTASPA